MKSPLSPGVSKFLIPLMGLMGLGLRWVLVATGTDEKGLLVPGHPAWIALLALTAAAAAWVLLCIRRVHGSGSYRASFPNSVFPAAGCLAAAAGSAMTALTYWQTPPASQIYNPVTSAARLVGGGVLTLVPLVFLALTVFRFLGRKPHFLFHALACISFLVQALTLYQHWSFDPQVTDYCFELFACLALALTAYRLAMFDLGKGSHRKLWLSGLAAVYLCCVSAGSGTFYITGAVWALTSLSDLHQYRYLTR